ncbi:MAG: hypothetical protein NTV80_15500 [Verrucomicrobia bacterium]|nr:hypothetical protein [Verrucomicrobiota bacterium]
MHRLLFIFLILLALNGCQQTQLGADADEPMFGKAKTDATFLVSSEEPVGVGELVRVARIIGPYRELQPAEIAELELRLEKELDRLVEIEYQQMLKEEKTIVRTQPSRRRVITRETARERLLARLGKDLALPLLTSDNRSAVVFGRVNKGDIKVLPTAYEINRQMNQEPPQQVVTPAGARATIFDPLP